MEVLLFCWGECEAELSQQHMQPEMIQTHSRVNGVLKENNDKEQRNHCEAELSQQHMQPEMIQTHSRVNGVLKENNDKEQRNHCEAELSQQHLQPEMIQTRSRVNGVLKENNDKEQRNHRFIEKVLKNVGRQHVDVDNLSLHDLDQLSSLIADALQVVDKDQGPNRGLTQARTRPRDLEGELRSDEEEEKEEEVAARDEEEEKLLANAPTLKPQGSTPIVPAELQVRHTEAEEQNVKDTAEDGSLLTKLLAYLDKTSLNASPSANNWHDVAIETPRGHPVGLENVQSRTSQVGVAVQKKDAAQSVEEVSEVQGWIKEVAPPPAALVYEEPHKKTMHVPELQLDVKDGRKKAEDDVFGYVITDTDGLQTDEGLHLMEILARRARIQMTDFAELSRASPSEAQRISVVTASQNGEGELVGSKHRDFARGTRNKEEKTMLSLSKSKDAAFIFIPPCMYPSSRPRLSLPFIRSPGSLTAGPATFHLPQPRRISILQQQKRLVVGPAVTFRVSPNAQNVSTTDVANVAGRPDPVLHIKKPRCHFCHVRVPHCEGLRAHRGPLSSVGVDVKTVGSEVVTLFVRPRVTRRLLPAVRHGRENQTP
ncbi:unnamed protein product [Pleuronectes platessa]|uniref:Protein-tyrosine phosphatase receptor IA-2 ectodomain domain-containing protein n=1 Tax=Pleuronectes platessa TaxID=8262 RepID=A0A9N7Z8W8_PLEPL|nr:unnamed protein product [Pleuronectes platessa]